MKESVGGCISICVMKYQEQGNTTRIHYWCIVQILLGWFHCQVLEDSVLCSHCTGTL